MAQRHVPVVILAGFLGAGKTTLLNHLLQNAGGRRIGVLVNDFGAVNIDALLVAGAASGTMTLENGCMCCTTDAEGLGDSLAALASPQSGIEAVLIEASGIAEPKALIRLVLAARDEVIGYGGLVYVVDAAQIRRTLDEHPSVREHLAVADLVVCNKADLLTPDELDAVTALLGGLNPTAPIVTVTEAAVDPELLFDPAPERAVEAGPQQLTLDALLAEDAAHDHAGPDHDHAGHDHAGHDHAGHDHDHLHAAFETASIDVAEPVDPRRLAAFLERPPAGAYRIKGTVLVDLPGHRDHAYVIQAVGGFVRVSTRPWDGRASGSSLVVIGAGLDPVEARSRLHAVVRRPDDVVDGVAVDEHGILHLTRHLVTGD